MKSVNYDSQRLVIESKGIGKVDVILEYYSQGQIVHAELLCNSMNDCPVEIVLDGSFVQHKLTHIYPS